jgi:branched-chain amino acid transport system permease protein
MEYLLHIIIITGIYIILSLSLNIIVGYTGLPNLGHAAFSCVGAYTSAVLTLNFGLSPWLGLIIGGCTSSLLGFFIGVPSLRLKGDYLALSTFGFGVIIYSIVKNWSSVTRGPMGLPNLPSFSVFNYRLTSDWSYLFLVAFFVFLTYFAIRRIINAPFGRVLRGIREDEVASQAMGKNVNRYKIIVFIIGAFFAGIAGSLYAHYITFIDPSSFTVMESITVLLMVVFGGMGSLYGSLVGAIILVIFPEALRFFDIPTSVAAPLRQLIYGLMLIILMLKRPQGLLGQYKWQ